jgi:predicted MFS family arabinose efflux permease
LSIGWLSIDIQSTIANRQSAMKRHLVWLMAASTGLIVAGIYYIQPLLADIAREFGISAARVAVVAMMTQIGTASGMLFFVPLGDKYERRALITTLLAAATVALALVALARNVVWLAAASFAVGATAATVQIIVPFAAHLAPERERGRIVGTVLGGLLVGILLARTFSGVLGARFGWRAVYAVGAAAMLGLATLLRFALPASRPAEPVAWRELMYSIAQLVREQRVLRESALIAGILFFSFTSLWTTIVFVLRTPPYHYGTSAAGVFGLLGAGSAAAAPIVGRLSDRHGPERAILVAIVTALAGYALLFLFGRSFAGLVLAIVLIDVGVQAGHVANQSRIYALIPTARSRLNTFYMVSFFIGGSAGSYLGPLGWNLGGWMGFCACPLAALVFATGYFASRGVRGSLVRQPRAAPNTLSSS